MKKLHITAAVLDKLTADLPFLPAPEVRKLLHLRGLQLADPRFDVPRRIDLRVGSDLMDRVLQGLELQGQPLPTTPSLAGQFLASMAKQRANPTSVSAHSR